MSIVWEDTDGYAKKYKCALATYLITVLSYLYKIIMHRSIYEPGHGIFFDGLNATNKLYLK